MFKGKFEDIVLLHEGFLRGPFGSALKKSLFVPKAEDTYKVYEQSVVLQEDKTLGEYYISKKYFEENLSRFEVKSGDFLVSCSGVNYGAIYQLKGEIDKGVINQALLRIRINPEIVDENYFLYYFRAYIGKKITGGTGDSTIPNFPPMSVVKGIDIQLPDINIQRKIGKILAKIDDKINNNNTINAELESMARTIYDYWFLQFDFPDKNGKPYRSSGGKMVWNDELRREIPEGWESTTLGDITNCYDSSRIPLSSVDREKRKGNIPYYGATGIMDYVNEAIFDGDYVLMAEDGSVMDEKGNPILQRLRGKAWVNNHAHVLQPSKNHGCKLLMMLLKDISVMKIKTGSIQMKINQENMNKIIIPKIPDKLLRKINYKLDIIDKYQLQLIRENEKLSKLRDFLLPLLINGQVGFKS